MASIFDKIISGEIPCYKVYENDNVLAFLDVKPHAKGHTLVIHKKAGVSALDYSADELADVMKGVRAVMEKLKEKLGCDGFNVGWNDGSIAGQAVPHLHVHVFPRYEGDGGKNVHAIVNNDGGMSLEEVAALLK